MNPKAILLFSFLSSGRVACLRMPTVPKSPRLNILWTPIRGRKRDCFTAQDGAFDSEVETIAPVDLNVTGLAVGPHLIGIRYKDDNNTWGEVLYQTIHVYDPNPNVGGSGGGGASGSSAGFVTIQAAEYFVDTDPGEGNGTAFQAQDGAFDSEVESILPKTSM